MNAIDGRLEVEFSLGDEDKLLKKFEYLKFRIVNFKKYKNR